MHLMVDIETASREPNAAILSIGACLFHPYIESAPEDLPKKEWRIDPESSLAYDLHFCQGTLAWWEKQSPESRRIAFSGDRDLKEALTELHVFAMPATKVWANDPDFDCTILKKACEVTSAPWGFQYWDSMATRTIKWLAYPTGGEPKHDGVAHSALDDAVHQACLVSHCYSRLGNNLG